MLGAVGYKYKKDLKASVGQPLNYIETSMFGTEFKPNGKNTVVGSDAYRARDWFATVTCKEGIIMKVE